MTCKSRVFLYRYSQLYCIFSIVLYIDYCALEQYFDYIISPFQNLNEIVKGSDTKGQGIKNIHVGRERGQLRIVLNTYWTKRRPTSKIIMLSSAMVGNAIIILMLVEAESK